MKKLLLLTFILISCGEGYTLNEPIIEKDSKAYIYDNNTESLDSCTIIGYIGSIQINRKCDIFNGYIYIGSSKIFKEEGYNVDLFLYLDNNVIHIEEYKYIFNNITLQKD